MMDAHYQIWNDAIGRYFFRPEYAGEWVFLAVDKETLLSIAAQAEPAMQFSLPEWAEQDLLQAVRVEIHRHGWLLGDLQKAANTGDYPRFLAQLAVQVLAVANMREDEEWSNHAYWPRLCEMLDPDCARRWGMPLGLTYQAHLDLWRGLERWANELRQGRLGFVRLPPIQPQGERNDHIALPKSQALLREADLRTLPEFFDYVGLRPDEDDLDLIKERVDLYQNRFFRHAQRVLADPDRFDAACEQIARVLRRWDGSTYSAEPNAGFASSIPQAWESSGLVLWLYMRAGFANLKGGLAERTTGTAVLTDLALSQLLIRVSQQGVVVDPSSGRGYRPIRRDCWLTVYDEFEGRWIEKRYARPGDDLILLLPTAEFSRWHPGACRIGESIQWFGLSGELRTPLAGLPAGWNAMHCVVRGEPQLDSGAGPWCELIRCRDRMLIPVGGLRLSRTVWMAGAAPSIHLHSPDAVQKLRLDGKDYQVDGNFLTPAQAPVLNNPGVHVVTLVGYKPLRIEVQQPVQSGAYTTLPEGWRGQAGCWPQPPRQCPSDATTTSAGHCRGPVIDGDWSAQTPAPGALRRQAIELALQWRGQHAPWLHPATPYEHPLLLALQAAIRRTRFQRR